MECSPLISGLLILMLLAAGCSDKSGSETAAPAGTIQPDARYVAGDIVAKTATQAEPLWFILGYDRKTDLYERTFILKNEDGTWGYRKDTKSDTFPRADMEKLYPVKVTHVSVSSVPVVTATVSETIATITTTTVISYNAYPQITSITPDTGASGSSVMITVAGKDFVSGAAVKLVGAGLSPIDASRVQAIDTKITCVFNLYGTETGKYAIIVTNPDGKSATLADAFTITEAAPIITSINPYIGNIGETLTLTISGSNFKNPAKVYIVKSGAEFEGANVQVRSSTEITCVLTIPEGIPAGEWGVIVRNIGAKQNSTAVKKFSIRNTM